MRRYLRLNTVLESLIEFYILQHLRSGNEHIDDFLLYDHQITIHSVEVVDDDLLLANIEHSLYDNQAGKYCAPAFSQVEITPCWPAEKVFNIDDMVYDEANSFR